MCTFEAFKLASGFVPPPRVGVENYTSDLLMLLFVRLAQTYGKRRNHPNGRCTYLLMQTTVTATVTSTIKH